MTRLLLAVIVAAAFAVRLWGISFGLPHVLARPDELFILGIVAKMHGGNPNPRMFDYPGLYLYFVAGLFTLYYAWGLAVGRFSSTADFLEAFRTAWEPFFLLPRIVNAALGAGTAALCHAIAAPLFGTAAGLLSALFMGLAFLHVRDSHYATTDIPMTFFITCAMLAVTRVHRGRRARDAWLAGVMGGLAAGTKYNAVLLALPMIAVEVLYAWRRRAGWRLALRETHLPRMGIAFALTFATTSPFLFLDYRTALAHLGALHESTTTGMTPPHVLGRGWWYHLPYSLRHGLGAPLLASGLAGMAWMSLRRPALALILGIFPVAYYVVAGAGYNVFVRYMMPVVPFLCIFAGYAVSEAAAALARTSRLRREFVTVVLGLLVIAPSALSVSRFDALIAKEDSRLIAARWIHQHVPAGSSIYASGNLYGHPQLAPPVGKYRPIGYDWDAHAFTDDRRQVGELPDWIVVQRSALPYSHIPERVERLLTTDYQLEHVVRAADLGETGNFYDIQDGFYAPYAGFKGVTRPGPNLEIYRRRLR